MRNEKPIIKQKTSAAIGKAFAYLVASVLAIVFLFPFYYTIINSLRPIVSTPTMLLPKGFELINYHYAVTLIPFFKYFFNTIVIEIISLSSGMFFNFMYGYALARLKAPGKGIVFTLVLSQMMVPFVAIQIPQYILFSNLGFKDTYWIYLVNGICGSAMTVFIYRQYMLSFPKSIEEAAMIDGCSVFSIMWRVIAPISKPIVAVILFKDFTATWNDYMTAYMYLSEEKYPISMALFGVSYILPSNPNLKLVPVQNAAAILIMIPTMILFFLCQKQLVSGVTSGSIKE